MKDIVFSVFLYPRLIYKEIYAIEAYEIYSNSTYIYGDFYCR